jgi:hypothetical protein
MQPAPFLTHFALFFVQADAAALKALKGQLGDKGFVKAKVGGKK